MRVVFSLLVVFSLVGCDSKEERAEKNCIDSSWAWVMAQKYVRNNLNSPSSAKFPSLPITAQHLTGCKHIVVGEFEAQNAFGVYLKRRFSAVLTYDKATDTWQGADLHIQ